MTLASVERHSPVSPLPPSSLRRRACNHTSFFIHSSPSTSSFHLLLLDRPRGAWIAFISVIHHHHLASRIIHRHSFARLARAIANSDRITFHPIRLSPSPSSTMTDERSSDIHASTSEAKRARVARANASSNASSSARARASTHDEMTRDALNKEPIRERARGACARDVDDDDDGFAFADDDAYAEASARARAAYGQGRARDAFENASRDEEMDKETNSVCASHPCESHASATKKRELTYWGLTRGAKRACEAKGVRALYDWQVDCLSLPGVFEGAANLLFSAPTSGGKSLVADILMLRRLAARPGTIGVFVLPFVALCDERANSLEGLFAGTEVRVRRLYGARGGTLPTDAKRGTIVVATPERANQIASRLIEDNRFHELSVVVVDELHMIQDGERGATMELLITKLLYCSGVMRRKENVETSVHESQMTHSVGRTSGNGRSQSALQIVGMSASIPNLASLAEWLFAQLYVSKFRPITLEISIKVGHQLFDAQTKTVKRAMMNATKDADVAHLAELCHETIEQNGSVLVFCSTKARCKSVADQLRHALRNVFNYQRERSANHNGPSNEETVAEFMAILGASNTLEPYLVDGVAFHHSGLAPDERELVEESFRRGVVRVLCCTTSLATGVNLPARRVIIRDLTKGIVDLNARDIQQMTGRAGRAGLDTSGSAVVFCPVATKFDSVCDLVEGPTGELESAVAETGMRRIMLESVASGLVKSLSDVEAYIKCTLLSALNDFDDMVQKIAREAIQWCQRNGLLVWNQAAMLWSASSLGLAVAAGMFPLEFVRPIIEDIRRAREDLVLSTPLHLLFLLTHPPVIDQASGLPCEVGDMARFDTYKFQNIWERLNQVELRIAEKVGISELYVHRLRLNRKDTTTEHALQRFKCRRFMTAMMMTDVIQEMPNEEISKKYGETSVQMTQESCARFASGVASICGSLGWSDMEALVARMHDRITSGAQEEILQLTKIPQIGIARARALYNGGIKTPQAIVSLGSIEKIARVLKEHSKTDIAQAALIRAARQILNRAKELVVNQSRVEREEAEARLLELDKVEAATTIDLTPDDTSALPALNISEARGATLLRKAEDVESFMTAWERSAEYAVVFQPDRDDPGGAPVRIAIALDANAVFIAKVLYERHDQDKVVGIHLDRALHILSQVGPKKYTIDLQAQLRGILGTRGTYTERLFTFAAPSVDVRIAAWLIHVDAVEVKSVSDANRVLDKDPTETLAQLLSSGFDASSVDSACTIDETRHGHLRNMSRATATCFALGRHLWTSCEERGLLRALLDIEMPFVSTIVAMQISGVPFSPGTMREQLKLLDTQLQHLFAFAVESKWIYEGASLDSPIDVGLCLFEHLKLPPPPSAIKADVVGVSSRKQKYTTDKGVLDALIAETQHPFPKLLKEYRALKRAHGEAESLLEMVGGETLNEPLASIRIRCSMAQTNTETGRLSHEDPNLHTVPLDKPCSMPCEPGAALPTIRMRSAFVASPGKLLLCADFSQIELRMAAHFSGDETLIQALSNPTPDPENPGDDIFITLASKWLRKSLGDVKSSERDACKACVYAFLYGSGAANVARKLGITTDEASYHVGVFRETLPKLQNWRDTVLQNARDQKPVAHVTTISARRRNFPSLHSKDNNHRSRAEREALNTVCQGSASDVFKRACLLVINKLRTAHLLERCQLILTIHDECVFEVDARAAKAVAHVVRGAMESVAREFTLAVPLPVKVRLGRSLSPSELTFVPRLSSATPTPGATPSASPIKSSRIPVAP